MSAKSELWILTAVMRNADGAMQLGGGHMLCYRTQNEAACGAAAFYPPLFCEWVIFREDGVGLPWGGYFPRRASADFLRMTGGVGLFASPGLYDAIIAEAKDYRFWATRTTKEVSHE